MMPATESAACPLCGGAMGVRYRIPHIWHQPKGTREYVVLWCGSCGFGLLRPQPSQQELDSFYGDNYFSRYARESRETYQFQADFTPRAPTLLDRVRIHLAWRLDRGRAIDATSVSQVIGRGPLRICDIGCGNGQLLADFRGLGHRVVGVEVDEHARRRAAAKGLAVFPGYAEALPDAIKSQPFDAVCMVHVLEHCADPLLALRNAAELLSPGGYLIVEVPNNDSILGHRSGPSWFYSDAGRHLNFFSAKSLAKAAESLRFEIVARRFSGYVSAFLNTRLAAEQSAWDRLYVGEAASIEGRPARNSKRAQWISLARTLFAVPERKYEVVAIIARRKK